MRLLDLSRFETPEEYFREHLESHDGVPYKVQSHAAEKAFFEKIRDELKSEPECTDEEFFRMFHRNDGYFSLLQKGRIRDRVMMKDVGSIKVENTGSEIERLKEYLPSHLNADVYFTVNSYYKTLEKVLKPQFLKKPARKEFNISWLNACYADIDVGRSSVEDEQRLIRSLPEALPKDYDMRKDMSMVLSWEQALLQAMIMEFNGAIPPVSIYARSGRGIYLFWLLAPVKYHKARPYILEDYKKCNRAIGESLRGSFPDRSILPADANATDGARILRIHGSLHAKAGSKVCYFPSRLEDVIPDRIYTLNDIMSFYSIKTSKVSVDIPVKIFKGASRPYSCPARSRGVIQSYVYRINDLKKLFQDGHIRKGKRYASLRYLALFCRRAHVDDKEALSLLREMAPLCVPPYPTRGEANDIDLERIVNSVYCESDRKVFLINNNNLVTFWNIDTALAERLNLHSFRPREAKAYIPPVSTKQQGLKQRREALLGIVTEGHSLNELVRLMEAKGFHVPKTTLREDLKYLREHGMFSRENKKAGRPRKT